MNLTDVRLDGPLPGLRFPRMPEITVDHTNANTPCGLTVDESGYLTCMYMICISTSAALSDYSYPQNLSAEPNPDP